MHRSLERSQLTKEHPARGSRNLHVNNLLPDKSTNPTLWTSTPTDPPKTSTALVLTLKLFIHQPWNTWWNACQQSSILIELCIHDEYSTGCNDANDFFFLAALSINSSLVLFYKQDEKSTIPSFNNSHQGEPYPADHQQWKDHEKTPRCQEKNLDISLDIRWSRSQCVYATQAHLLRRAYCKDSLK